MLNAPEQLSTSRKPFTPQSDVYNAAAILYLLYTGGGADHIQKERFEFKEPCWKAHLAAHKVGVSQDPSESTAAEDAGIISFLAQGLCHDYQKRPSASLLLEHPFITKLDTAQVVND